MRVASVFERAFSKIYGKPCWQVGAGHGSFLTAEFGKPSLEIREPIAASRSASPKVRARLAQRRVTIHGEWHLWIYCCEWAVFNRSRRMGDSSTTSKISRAIDFLDGQKLERFTISRQNIECAFYFDLGAVLRTKPYDRESEQWMLYEPSEKALVLRADGYYRHNRSDIPDRTENWHHISE